MGEDSRARIKELVDRAIVVLQRHGATEVYLFGSAREAKPDHEPADIDLAVRGIPQRHFYGAVGEVLCELQEEVDVVDLDAGTAFGTYLSEHGELLRVA
jgi:predicted nucleotidyltransferase